MRKSLATRPFRVALRLLLVGVLSVGPPFPAGAALVAGAASSPSDHVPPAATQPGAPAITATKTDALVNDVDGDTLPDPGDTLRYTVVVTNSGATDALGVVLSDTLDANTTLTGAVQASPLAVGDTYTATEDTVLVIGAGTGVLANDFGQPAPIVVPQASAPTAQGGAVTLNADGSFTYNPPAAYTGPDSFSYTTSNSSGTDSGQVDVNVYALPVAVEDGYSTVQDSPLVVPVAAGVLHNDTPNDGTITAYAATTAEGGSVSLALDGSFVYTPTSGFFSPPTDTFTYTLSNVVGSDTSTVTLTVNLPGPPVAVDDAYTVTANTPLSVPAVGLLGNDTLNAATISAYQATTSQGGSVALSADGGFVYTPTTDYISPPADIFTYTLTNLIGSSMATVALTVQPAGPPVAVDDSYTTTANTPLTVTAGGVLGNDTQNFAAISGYAATTAQGGAVTLNLDGSFTYTPTTDYVSPPTDIFTYTLSNVLGADTATVSIIVEPPGPPVAVDNAYTATVNTPLTVPAGGVLGNDTQNFATLAEFQALTARGGSVALAPDGGFIYTPTTDFISPPVDTFTYTLGNLLGASTAMVTVTVNPAGPPVAVADSYTVTANTLLTLPVDGVLANDTLNFGAIAEYQATTSQGGTVALAPDGSFVYTPTTDFLSPPADTFTYTLTNTIGAATAEVTITALPPALPDAVDDSYGATANTTLTVTAASGVLDNDTLNFAVISDYQAATSAGGTVTLAPDGGFVYTPTADFVSPPTDSFTYTLTNALGSDTATVTITVAPPGVPLAVDDTYTATVDTDLLVAAPGVLGNDTTNFGTLGDYATTTTRGGSVMLAASGAFTYTPPAGVVSPPDDAFTYTVSNALGSASATVSITLYPPPPDAVDDSYTATGNITLTVPVSGVLTNDALNFATLTSAAITSAQGGNVVVNANGSFSYKSAPGFEGTDTFTYTLSNITASAAATVEITVSGVVWFVDNTASAGDGRLGSPYNSLASLQGADTDDPGDVIFVYQGSGDYTGGLVLENNQALLGQGVTLGTALTSLGITVAPNSATLPGAASSPTITNAGGHGVTLASTNTVRGLTLGTSEAASFALLGDNIGTLTANSLTINSGAGGISLTAGTANVTLGGLTTSGAAHGLNLSSIAGTLDLGSGTVTGATSATVSVNGGTAAVTYSGNMTQGNNAPLVSVSGGHSGPLTFQTGTLNATNGTGLRFDNADGAYSFNGATTLNGGDAGIDILSGSAGTFSFSANTSVTNPSGTAFNLDASPATLTYSGSLSANAGFLVDIGDHDAGTLTFQTGAFSATGQGVRVQASNGGTINFNNPAKTLSTGANAAVTLSNNTGATINFGTGNLALNTTSGAGLTAIGGGTVNVAGANNTIATGSGTAVTLSGTSGAQTFRSVAANGAPNGLSLSNTTGSFEVTGDGASDPANTTRGRTTAGLGGSVLVLGSGGSVAATTDAAVLLSNAANVTLRNMTLSTAGGSVNDGRDAIRVSNSSNLTLDNVLINGSGNGVANNSGLEASGLAGLTILHNEIRNAATTIGVESSDVWAVDLTNVTGTAAVSHSIFDTARENVFGLVEAGSSTLNLTVTNALFQNANIAGVGNNGLGISAANTANVSVTILDSEFLRFYGNGFQYNGVDQSGGGRIHIENSTFDDDGSSINIAHQGQSRTLQFDIQNNDIRTSGIAPGVPGNALNAINLLLGDQANSNSVLEGYLTENTIGNVAQDDSGSAQGNGVGIKTFGAGTLTLSASNNSIRQIGQDHAFWAFASKQTATAGVGAINLLLTGNDFSTDSSGLGLAGLGISAGAGAFAGDSPTICANLLGNTQVSGDAAYAGIDLTLVGTSPTVNLVGYSGAANDTAQIEAFLGTVAGTVSPAPLVTIGAGTVVAIGACQAPSFTQGSVQSSNTMLGRARGGKVARLASQAPASVAPLAPAAGSVQVDVGTLPAGRAVTITFDVVITEPIPVGTNQVSNQAQVAGSDFAPVLSDDPDTTAANDPTVTVLAPPENFSLYLPLVAYNYGTVPDLVGSFSLSPGQTAFGAGQPVTITVAITNAGAAPAHGFWVDFYLNPSSPPSQGNQPWDSVCGLSPCYGLAWKVDDTLNPGESLTLTSTAGSYWAANTLWPGYFAGGTTDLYLYVDSFSNPSSPAGAVLELNETNNRAELHGLSVPLVAGGQADSARQIEDLPAR
ncbi:MAG: tandem-95 repeat protein [Anaerolineales bacterium]|nr:tandem-95 repeat protein [Anaerolineales bacterium]